jgi:hypothetical protein
MASLRDERRRSRERSIGLGAPVSQRLTARRAAKPRKALSRILSQQQRLSRRPAAESGEMFERRDKMDKLEVFERRDEMDKREMFERRDEMDKLEACPTWFGRELAWRRR